MRVGVLNLVDTRPAVASYEAEASLAENGVGDVGVAQRVKRPGRAGRVGLQAERLQGFAEADDISVRGKVALNREQGSVSPDIDVQFLHLADDVHDVVADKDASWAAFAIAHLDDDVRRVSAGVLLDVAQSNAAGFGAGPHAGREQELDVECEQLADALEAFVPRQR